MEVQSGEGAVGAHVVGTHTRGTVIAHAWRYNSVEVQCGGGTVWWRYSTAGAGGDTVRWRYSPAGAGGGTTCAPTDPPPDCTSTGLYFSIFANGSVVFF